MPAEATGTLDTTDDAVLGGRLLLRQPRRGHRFGHDAILLAAAVPAGAGERAIDLGAGVGAAGLALARRVEKLSLALVEIDPALVALARHNIERNGFADWASAFCLDVEAAAADYAAAGLSAQSADRVLMNPPFNIVQQPSPEPGRRSAHAASAQTLARWLQAATRLLRADGTVTLIWRADGLADVLAGLGEGFGAVTALPVHPKPGATAIRVLVCAIKASRGPFALPGLTLADADGKPTPQAEAVLRGAEAIAMIDD